MIFYIQNVVDYLKNPIKKKERRRCPVYLAALASEGKILLPVEKTTKEAEKVKTDLKNRSALIAEAKQGNQEAMQSLTFDDIDGKKAYWHTASHIMAQAVKRLYPEVKLTIGPAIEHGFYYDFDADFAFSAEILKAIEDEMKKIVKENLKIERSVLSRADALELMKDQPYKVEKINSLPDDAVLSFYRQGEFTELCAGPHLMSTKPLKAIKLISSSGAYWRGKSENQMLARIYGTAFAKKDELNAYLEHLEDIKKRDHNKLGREMEIFTTVDVIGQGLPIGGMDALVIQGILEFLVVSGNVIHGLFTAIFRALDDDIGITGGNDIAFLCYGTSGGIQL